MNKKLLCEYNTEGVFCQTPLEIGCSPEGLLTYHSLDTPPPKYLSIYTVNNIRDL